MNFFRNRFFRQFTAHGPGPAPGPAPDPAITDPAPLLATPFDARTPTNNNNVSHNNVSNNAVHAIAPDAAPLPLTPYPHASTRAFGGDAPSGAGTHLQHQTSDRDRVAYGQHQTSDRDRVAYGMDDVMPTAGAPPSEPTPRAYSDVATNQTSEHVTPRQLFNIFNHWPTTSASNADRETAAIQDAPVATSRAFQVPIDRTPQNPRRSYRPCRGPVDEFGFPISYSDMYRNSQSQRPSSVRLSERPTSVRMSGRPSSVRLSERPASVRPSHRPSSVRYSTGAPPPQAPFRECTEARLNRLSGRMSFRIPRYMQTPRQNSMPPGAAPVADVRARVKSLANRGDRPTGTWAALNPPRSNSPPPFEPRVLQALAIMRKNFENNPVRAVQKRKSDIRVPDLPMAKRRRRSGEFATAGGASAIVQEESAGVLPQMPSARPASIRIPISKSRAGSKVIYTGYGMGKRRARKTALSKVATQALEEEIRIDTNTRTQESGHAKELVPANSTPHVQGHNSQKSTGNGPQRNVSFAGDEDVDKIAPVNQPTGSVANGIEQPAKDAPWAAVEITDVVGGKASVGGMPSTLPTNSFLFNSDTGHQKKAEEVKQGVGTPGGLSFPHHVGTSTSKLSSQGFPAAPSAEGKSVEIPANPSVASLAPKSSAEGRQDHPSNPVSFSHFQQSHTAHPVETEKQFSSRLGIKAEREGETTEGIATQHNKQAAGGTPGAALYDAATTFPSPASAGFHFKSSAAGTSNVPTPSSFGGTALGNMDVTSLEPGAEKQAPLIIDDGKRKKRRAGDEDDPVDKNISTSASPPISGSGGRLDGVFGSGNTGIGQKIGSVETGSQVLGISSFAAAGPRTIAGNVEEATGKVDENPGSQRVPSVFATDSGVAFGEAKPARSVVLKNASVEEWREKAAAVALPFNLEENKEAENRNGKDKDEAVQDSDHAEAPNSFASGFPLGPVPTFASPTIGTASFAAPATTTVQNGSKVDSAAAHKESDIGKAVEVGDDSKVAKGDGYDEVGGVVPDPLRQASGMKDAAPGVPAFGSTAPVLSSFGASASSFGITAGSFSATAPTLGLSSPSFGAKASSFAATGASLAASAPLGATAAALATSGSSFGASGAAFAPATTSAAPKGFLFRAAPVPILKSDAGPFANANFGAPQTQQANMSSFVFGGVASGVGDGSVATASAAAQTNVQPFAFGAQGSAPSSAPGFSFGSATATPTSIFGASASIPGPTPAGPVASPPVPSTRQFGATAAAIAFGGTSFGGGASFGTSTPAFGAPSAPAFNLTAPAFGSNAPAFGASAFGAGSGPAPAFGTPSRGADDVIGAANDGGAFGASAAGFGTSGPAFGAGAAAGAGGAMAFGGGGGMFAQSHGGFSAPAPVNMFGGGAAGGAFGGGNATPMFGANAAAGMPAPAPGGAVAPPSSDMMFNSNGANGAGSGAFSAGLNQTAAPRRRFIRAKRMGPGPQR